MKLKIITPEKLLLEQEVSSVTLPGTEGEMTILPHHAAMVATLKKGKVLDHEVAGGFVEVLKDQVLVIMVPSPMEKEGFVRRQFDFNGEQWEAEMFEGIRREVGVGGQRRQFPKSSIRFRNLKSNIEIDGVVYKDTIDALTPKELCHSLSNALKK